MRSDIIKNLVLWLVIAVILIAVFNNFGPKPTEGTVLTYSQLMHEVDQKTVASVVIENQNLTGILQNGKHFSTYLPLQNESVIAALIKENVAVTIEPPHQPSLLFHIFISWFPMLLLLGFFIFAMRQQMGGGKGGAFSFGRSRAKLLSQDQGRITFADVAGCDEAKEEVSEVVDFLKSPAKYQSLGGKMPRGVLLVGPPGTGKTLLAKAVAGEAKVPFFSISGSDFVEMFVGVGASRVRDMFEQAKKHAPCIIFIDEIDAVGRHRGAGLGGGHDEREQTLNQLLVEMDGFSANDGIIVMAATNRPDVLDPALQRPGRFDRQVVVGLPDIRGREQILQVHAKKLPLDTDVDIKLIARGTPGFSGADLANLINEAALFAAKMNHKQVNMNDLEKAKDKILMGAERSSMLMDEKEKRLTAYHEAGHAIVGLSSPSHDPVYKVTIIPRGRALGVTVYLPEKDRYSYDKQRITSLLRSLYGGRVAELLIFGEEHITTGASNDIQRATELARNMVTKWGLSERLGPQSYSEDEQEVFLGHSFAKNHQALSPKTVEAIDEEIRRILDDAYSQAKKILEEKIAILHNMADALMKYETIGEEELSDLMAGKEASEPKHWQETLQQRADKAKAKQAEAEAAAAVAGSKAATPPEDTSKK